jgi:hypothetical protein
MTRPVLIRGAAAIAQELRVSEKTVRRRYRAGELTGAYQLTTGRGSPLLISKAALAALRKGKG